ncbi:MAG: CBS domain-containing protein, partial [Candidatus Dadabacteria bacterium]|nr:CBS domain-containing protein [Candidatus Dadabacteria bacterium]
FMSKELMAVKLEDTLKHCMSLMVKNQLSHLPVMDKKKLIGMISISDIAQGLNS